jgi:hypothetical protein
MRKIAAWTARQARLIEASRKIRNRILTTLKVDWTMLCTILRPT